MKRLRIASHSPKICKHGLSDNWMSVMKFAIDPLNERVGLSGDAPPPGARFHVIVGAVLCQSTLLVISLMYTNTLLRSCQLQ